MGRKEGRKISGWPVLVAGPLLPPHNLPEVSKETAQ